MKKNRDEMLPQIVEDRLQEAYEQIRRGEIWSFVNLFAVLILSRFDG